MADSAVTALKKLHSEAKTVRAKLEHDWYMNLAYYGGDQWIFWNRGRIDRPRLEEWRVKFVDNRILPAVVARVARRTKNRPSFVATPSGADEADFEASEVVEKILQSDWNTLKLDQKHLMAEFWTEICCAGFWKIYWDKTQGNPVDFLYGPEGPIKSSNGGPLRYDQAQSDGTYDTLKANYGDQLQTQSLSLGDVAVDVISPFEVFPDPLATAVHECEWVIEEKVRSVNYIKQKYDVEVRADAVIAPGVAESRMFPSSGMGGGEGNYKGVTVYEYFCKPNAEHPNGKWCVWLQDKVVKETDGPQSPYCEFPYVMFTGNIVPGRFWPTSITTQLRGPQTDLNKLQSQIRENAIRIGNPALLVSRQANIEYTGLPGERIDYDDTVQNAVPQYLQPPEIPGYVREEVDRIQNSIVEISGLHDVSNGEVPSGITAASAINLLQEADDTRLGPEIQLMERTLGDAGLKIVKLRAKFMPDERIVQMAGEDGNWDIITFKKEVLSKVDNVEVQAGSGMPRSKAAKQAAMTEILGMSLQYGVQFDPRALRHFIKDYDMGALEKLFQDIQPDETQCNREHRLMYNGQALMINDWDDDDIHIAAHGDEMKSSRFSRVDPNIQQLILLHWKAHKERRQFAIDQQVAAAQQEAAQQNGAQRMAPAPTAPTQ